MGGNSRLGLRGARPVGAEIWRVWEAVERVMGGLERSVRPVVLVGVVDVEEPDEGGRRVVADERVVMLDLVRTWEEGTRPGRGGTPVAVVGREELEGPEDAEDGLVVVVGGRVDVVVERVGREVFGDAGGSGVVLVADRRRLKTPDRGLAVDVFVFPDAVLAAVRRSGPLVAMPLTGRRLGDVVR